MLIECSHCSDTLCTVINVLTGTCWWLSVATVYTQSSTCHCENINYCTYGTRTVATLNQHVTVRTYCTYGTRTVATLNQHVNMRTYCTYDTRTVATLNHQHATVRTLITVHMVPGQMLIECSHCSDTLCTVINVLTGTCWWLSVATVLVPYLQ
jgi:hypothetical protein